MEHAVLWPLVYSAQTGRIWSCYTNLWGFRDNKKHVGSLANICRINEQQQLYLRHGKQKASEQEVVTSIRYIRPEREEHSDPATKLDNLVWDKEAK